METLSYLEESHQYYLGSEELPGVTTILKAVGEIDTSFMTDSGASVGKRRHHMTQLLDEGRFDWGSILPEDIPYAQGWEEFKVDQAPTFDAIEVKGYHPIYRYAGTADRLADIGGEKYIIDIKTGKPLKWHPLQATLYAMIFSTDDGELPGAICVYLREAKGKNYSMVTYDPRKYVSVATACLTLYQWRMKK